MSLNFVVMFVNVSVRDTMGAVLSWFTARVCALALDTASALKRWRVSKISFQVCSLTGSSLSCVCTCECVSLSERDGEMTSMETCVVPQNHK